MIQFQYANCLLNLDAITISYLLDTLGDSGTLKPFCLVHWQKSLCQIKSFYSSITFNCLYELSYLSWVYSSFTSYLVNISFLHNIVASSAGTTVIGLFFCYLSLFFCVGTPLNSVTCGFFIVNCYKSRFLCVIFFGSQQE